MKRQSKIALAQMTSTEDIDQNSEKAFSLLNKAAEYNADLVAFPECFLFLGRDRKCLGIGQSINGPLVEKFRKAAQEKNMAILMGSIPEKIEGNPDRIYNTSVYIDETGEIKGVYRKIHLFDLTLPEATFKESDIYKAGTEMVTVKSRLGILGMAICYDLRFPAFFQKMTIAGAQILFLPAAFTLQTGKDHWIPLLQARAIENQVYIAAPAQFGRHNEKRITYGSSVLIDPWGVIIARAPEKEGLIVGEVDLDYLDSVRKNMPIFSHRVASIDD